MNEREREKINYLPASKRRFWRLGVCEFFFLDGWHYYYYRALWGFFGKIPMGIRWCSIRLGVFESVSKNIELKDIIINEHVLHTSYNLTFKKKKF